MIYSPKTAEIIAAGTVTNYLGEGFKVRYVIKCMLSSEYPASECGIYRLGGTSFEYHGKDTNTASDAIACFKREYLNKMHLCGDGLTYQIRC